MKYTFFGTPEFAATVLDRLLRAGMPPVALVCNPDRPVGRKKIVTAPPTKSLLMRHGAQNMEVIQPEKLDSSFEHRISSLKPDFAIVAAYAKIIPKNIIDIFPKGVIGVHPSLLPKYRGASPIQSAILGGEKETGVTLYLLDEKMDHGPILTHGTYSMEHETYAELEKKLAELGGELLVESLPKFIAGKTEPRAQNEAEATYTKKFATEDGFVPESDLSAALSGENPEKALEIDRKIRALGAEPGVWTLSRSMKHETKSNGEESEKRIKLLEAKIENGRLVFVKVQEEGGRPKLVNSEASKL